MSEETPHFKIEKTNFPFIKEILDQQPAYETLCLGNAGFNFVQRATNNYGSYNCKVERDGRRK